jgi:hypothetical protein
MLSTGRITPVETARQAAPGTRMRRMLVAWSTCLGVCAGACGDNLYQPPDAPSEAEPFRTAPHVQMPVMSAHAKIVLGRVRLVTVTFEDDAARDVAEAFGDAAVHSAWYTTVGEEYMVEAPPVDRPPQRLRLGPAPATLTRGEIEALVPTTPLADDQVLYLIYIPPTVERGADLRDVRGYHDVVLRGDREIPFAVVLDDNVERNATALTTNAGRQLINAVTSPYPDPRDGYFLDPLATDPWSLVVAGPAELCESEPPIVEQGIAYPRIYSNAFAEQGFPCKPGQVDEPWTGVTAKPARLPTVRRNTTVTIELTGWSTHEVPDWQIETRVAERSAFDQAELQPQLTDHLINNGRTVTLTLQVPEDAPFGAAGSVYVLSGANRRLWVVGFVVQ